MVRPSIAGERARTGQRAEPAARRGPVILRSKLAPPEPAHATLDRPRLLTDLTRHVRRSPLTLLSGPTGSGKTVLAASWCRSLRPSGPSVGWVTLDEYDDDPAVFWSYLLEAASAAGTALSPVPELVPGEPPPGQLVTRLAADIAACARPVVLVLDEADHLADRSILAGLDLLVRNAGDRLRLVMCGRADPPLPLHRYRLAGTLSEIRTDDLAFTPDEAGELLTDLGAPVTRAAAEVLCVQTQGWAVGLRLAAAPLTQGVPPERLFTALARDDGSVAQYLFAEVLEGQPASVRRVLQRTSVTTEMWPDLVERLCGRPNVRRVMAGLVHANAFVEASPGAPGGFRIHPLFQEMLQAQLGYDHPGELARLHRTCAEWYAENGRPPVALGHAVAADDWSFVARLLVDDLRVPGVLAHGTDPVPGGMRALPSGVGGPEAAVVRMVAAMTAGHPPDQVDVATAGTAMHGGDRLALRISAGLAFLSATAATDRDATSLASDLDALTGLVTQLPEGEGQVRRECAAVLSHVRALWVSRTDAPTGELLTALRSAAAAARGAGARRLRARVVGELALLEAVTGRLTRATELAGEAEAFADEQGADGPYDPAPALALAWVHLHRYALVEAGEWLARAHDRPAVGRSRAVGIDALCAVLRGRLSRLGHDHDAAVEVLRPHVRVPGPRWIAEQVTGELVRLLLAGGQVEEALRVLADGAGGEPWRARLRATAGLLSGEPMAILPAAPRSGPAESVEASVVRACQLLEAGHQTAAADELGGALDLARPELHRSPFIDTPAQARRLLRAHPRLHSASTWLNPSSAAPSPARPTAAVAAGEGGAPPVQRLSDREREVLRYLAEMLSTAEIAGTMFISVNTVRTHIRSILRKLSVSRRNQAVRKAREHGLL